jgi:hypothetical protein
VALSGPGGCMESMGEPEDVDPIQPAG